MTRPFPPSAALLAGLLALGLTGRAEAHNTGVHRKLTDHAYEVMLMVQKEGPSQTRLPGLPLPASEKALSSADSEFPALRPWRAVNKSVTDAELKARWTAYMAEVRAALPRLRGLKGGLPKPGKPECQVDTVGWGQPMSSFEAMTLGATKKPIAGDYLSDDVDGCGIQDGWEPGGIFNHVNKGPQRDFGGTVLGVWSRHPDDEIDDVHMWIRPTNAGGLSEIKKILAGIAGAGAGVAYISYKCMLTCLKSFFGGECKKCVTDEWNKGQQQGSSAVAWVDGLVPGFGDHTSEQYVGLWHHIIALPPPPDGSATYDTLPGFHLEQAGVVGNPDGIEVGTRALADALGITVHYETSQGCQRYQVTGANDGHADSVMRGEDEWQFLSMAHTPFSPVDNVAWAGWKDFRDAGEARAARSLAGPLHAIGDATVPMHVTGTFGWGHRPFEDAIDWRYEELMFYGDKLASFHQARAILETSFIWREFIRDWRQKHGNTKDVPVRDLVTTVAQLTAVYVKQNLKEDWPFHPLMSTQYFVSKDDAVAYYMDYANSDELVRPLLVNAVAAELAFLTAASEVMP
ncbi:hypothetical protein [Pyxidicoccus caerfyrddinensis]|uniref:hypothetical protein n=1 Tax=Pyxidicoccus caerfyrddinensis TaxID=2709663 RepID=UPI0013DC8CB6|nr:hypothetical protein [Pyxidicoccus caerfyrddinensis]